MSDNLDYIEISQKKYTEKEKWDIAIGLQQVDNLTPSSYLEQLIDENISGKITIQQVEKGLRTYYEERNKNNKIDYNEYECDFVSLRIVELLNKKDFELSLDYIKGIHKYLFQDILPDAGSFKMKNYIKKEPILNRDTVIYGDFKVIKESLEYDISNEKKKKYKSMSINDVIDNIAKFSSSIWQIHPFKEGNTRTVAVFIQKYLIDMGYNVDNSLFKDKSLYYRNALVRSNYYNDDLNIKEDNSYLIKFYENLLLGKNNNLKIEDEIVKELFKEDL